MLTRRQRQEILDLSRDEPLEVLKACGGYYRCPRDASGKRLGPLVGYAGTYEPGKHWVGDEYANFAKAERYPSDILAYFVHGLEVALHDRVIRDVDVVCGGFMGGIATAELLAFALACGFVYPEKKVTVLADAGGREKSVVLFGRHEIAEGERVLVVEDVFNNFSTTAQLAELIREHGGIVVGVAGLLNRSSTVDVTYTLPDGTVLPVANFIRRPIPEYRQDDPAVEEDIKRGNVVWEPKPRDTWPRLMAAMEAATIRQT